MLSAIVHLNENIMLKGGFHGTHGTMAKSATDIKLLLINKKVVDLLQCQSIKRNIDKKE